MEKLTGNQDGYRVLFVSNSLSGGGAERATNLTVNYLRKLGVNVYLLLVEESVPDLVKVEVETFCLNRNRNGNILELLRLIRLFRRNIRVINPNFIILNCDYPEILGAFSPLTSRIIVVEHASRPWPRHGFVGRFTRLILLFRRVDWVAVSDHLRIWFLNRKPDYVIPNPSKLYSKEISNLESLSSREKGRLIFVGRLVKSKNPRLFLELAELSGKDAILIGAGDEKDELQKYATERRVKAEFKGFKENPWSEFNPEDILVITSANEGDGLVLVEAIMLRIPFLVLDIQDFRKFNLNPNNLFENSEEFTRKISSHDRGRLQLKPNYALQQSLIESRNPERIAELWQALFEKNKVSKVR